jgi:hypothetical protein
MLISAIFEQLLNYLIFNVAVKNVLWSQKEQQKWRTSTTAVNVVLSGLTSDSIDLTNISCDIR